MCWHAETYYLNLAISDFVSSKSGKFGPFIPKRILWRSHTGFSFWFAKWKHICWKWRMIKFMSHDFHLFSHETSVNMVLSMCQSHIFSGWNFEKKSQKIKKNIASDTFKNTYFAPFWKTNPDLVKMCQDKKPLASYGIDESHLSFVALLDQFKFSGDLWVIELLDFQDIIQPPIKLHGHNVATTTCMILHTHAVVLHKSLNVLLQNPKKTKFYVQQARSWICTRCHFETMEIIY